MKVVEPEFKILRISEPVSLPFEGLDFVDETFDGATGDPVIEVVEQPGSIGGKGFSDPFECLDPLVHRIPAPDIEELFSLFSVVQFPEQSQLLFH